MRREVDADLVGPPGLQPARQQRHVGRARRADAPPRTRCAPACRRRPRAIRSGSPGSRPIGASMMPCGALGCPHTSAVVPPPGGVGGELGDQRVGGLGRAGDDEQPRAAGVEAVHDARAHPARRRRRCSGKRASRPLTSVPRRLPAPGCTTRPAGLSTTMTASSAWTTTNSTSASPARAARPPGSPPCRPRHDGPRCEAHLAARDRRPRRRSPRRRRSPPPPPPG